MKKVLAVIIAVALLLVPTMVVCADGISLPIDFFGSTGKVTMSAQPSVVYKGQEFNVYVSYNKKGNEILCFDISFNSEYVTLVGAESCREGWVISYADNSYNVYNETGSALTGTTQLVKLTFKVNASAAVNSSFVISAVNCANATDTLSDASVTVNVLPLIGDVDGNGTVNDDDVTFLTRALAGWQDYAITDEALADINGDGKVTLRDRAVLARYLAGFEGYDVYFE